MNSLSHIAWRKFKKNSLGVFGLIIITIAVIISFLGYVIFPDSTPYSNQMHLELSKKAEDDLMQWAMDNGEVNTDDPDDFIDWLDMNLDDIVKGKIREGFKSDAQRRAAFASGYKAKGKKGKKEEVKETTDKEINAVKKLSKDMQSVLKGYQKITGMGDKELKDTKHNDTYKSILDARDKVVTLIGTLQTGKLLKGEELKTFGDIETELNENDKGLLDVVSPGDWEYQKDKKWLFLGDWANPRKNEKSHTPEAALFNNCYYVYVLKIAENIAEILEKKETASFRVADKPTQFTSL